MANRDRENLPSMKEWEEWIQPGPYTGLGPRNGNRTGDRLFAEVCERLTADGRLDASDIEVEVDEGEVTLTGSVADPQAKELAEALAGSVSGVRAVTNRLESGGERWTDRVGESGVYPASHGTAPKDAEAHGMASWGQGERGAEGYQDHGDSELHVDRLEEDEK